MVGGYQIITAELENTDVEVKARVAHDFMIDEGASIWLHFPPEDVQFFHEDQAIRAG
jgi:glycerol transport system ATP-binding protein